MTTRRKREPTHLIWVGARPKSAQGKGKSRYIELIKGAAQEVIKEPLKNYGIKVEICYPTDGTIRQDVDNVIKPILDALIGIAYIDDSQIMSVKVTAVPGPGPKFGAIEFESSKDLAYKIQKRGGKYFAIAIYDRKRHVLSP